MTESVRISTNREKAGQCGVKSFELTVVSVKNDGASVHEFPLLVHECQLSRK